MTAKPEFWWGPKFSKSGCWVKVGSVFFNFQAAIDQLLAPETLDRIVDILANGDFCAALGDERCPAAVDVVIRFELLRQKGFCQHHQRGHQTGTTYPHSCERSGRLCRGTGLSCLINFVDS